MYECEVVRYTRNVIGVHVTKDDYIVASYEINLQHNKLLRHDRKWSRRLSSLELMIRAVEIEYRRHRWVVMFDGVFTESLEDNVKMLCPKQDIV